MTVRGFTLVELLVVVLIIALGVSVVGISVGGDSHRRMQLDAKQFANESALLLEEAILGNQVWGIDFYRFDDQGEERFGYRWLIRSPDDRWEIPLDETFAVEYAFSEGTGLRLLVDGRDEETDIEYKQQAATQTETALTARAPVGVGEASTAPMGADKVKPEIWLLSSGEMTAFELTVFDERDPESAVTVSADELGRVSVDRGEGDDELQ